jgi:hypothetical protein
VSPKFSRLLVQEILNPKILLTFSEVQKRAPTKTVEGLSLK